MYFNNPSEPDKPTIQNRHAMSLDNSQTIRSAFFISDGTAITAETLGRSILSQFASVPFETHVLPLESELPRTHLPFLLKTLSKTDEILQISMPTRW